MRLLSQMNEDTSRWKNSSPTGSRCGVERGSENLLVDVARARGRKNRSYLTLPQVGFRMYAPTYVTDLMRYIYDSLRTVCNGN